MEGGVPVRLCVSFSEIFLQIVQWKQQDLLAKPAGVCVPSRAGRVQPTQVWAAGAAAVGEAVEGGHFPAPGRRELGCSVLTVQSDLGTFPESA